MTQQQIAYMNAVTARENLDISRKQADAAMMQALTAEKKREAEQGWMYWSDSIWNAASTVGGIIAAALI